MSPPQLTKPAVLLFRGRGLLSALIRWQSRSPYSHAALLMPNGLIIESWPGAGVRIRELEDWRNVHVFTVPSMTAEQWEQAFTFAGHEVGSGYDWWGIIRFISRRNMPMNDRWFCSELVFSALKSAGVLLLARVDPWAVSPSMLSLSPLLTPSPIPTPAP